MEPEGITNIWPTNVRRSVAMTMAPTRMSTPSVSHPSRRAPRLRVPGRASSVGFVVGSTDQSFSGMGVSAPLSIP